MKNILCALGILVVIYGISFGLWCGLLKIICLCFGWTFTFKIAIGLYLIYCIIAGIIKKNK